MTFWKVLLLFHWIVFGSFLIGTTTVSYMPCEGAWRYPENCVEPSCIYVASWNFLDDADAIRFVVKAKAAGWTGIGFNDDMLMKNADAIIGWVTTKNTVVVTDRHCDGNSGAPMDDEQSVYDISGRREDGYQIIEFSRKRDTQDPNGQNYVFGDQKCPFFIFPIVGGAYDSYGGIQAHSQKAKPKVSPQRICVRSCNIDVPRRMVVSFPIVNRSWQPELESRQSAAFKKLEAELADPLQKLLGNTPGFRGTRVIAYRPASVIVDVEIIIDATANQTSDGTFAIDRSSLSVSNPERTAQDREKQISSEVVMSHQVLQRKVRNLVGRCSALFAATYAWLWQLVLAAMVLLCMAYPIKMQM